MSVNTKVNGELVRSAGLYKVNTPMSVAEYYSTEEHKIGVWTNGKPIYQISITGLSLALTANAWTTLTGVTIPNGEDLVGVECYGEYTEQYVINCTKVHLNKADGSIEVRCADSSTTLTGITLQYTKITDSEKGGVYAPIIPMQIASKYSTDEKVIGEWIDHKPLYQKSIHLTDVSFPNNSRTIVPWTGYISDIDVIAHAEAVTVDELNRNLNAHQITTFSSYGLAFYVDKTDGMIFSRGNGGSFTTDVVVTVRYTKTTDTAGTGLYSDDEAKLAMLGDVDLENLTDGQILKYNATSGKFENADESGRVYYPLDSTPVKIGKVGTHDLYRQYYTGSTSGTSVTLDSSGGWNVSKFIVNVGGWIKGSDGGTTIISGYCRNNWGNGLFINQGGGPLTLYLQPNARNGYEVWVDYYVVQE